jgi:hypothetical protein
MVNESGRARSVSVGCFPMRFATTIYVDGGLSDAALIRAEHCARPTIKPDAAARAQTVALTPNPT